jgi:hypothetical protein
MKPGDVILHDIQVLHGSPAGDGNPLRRTVYYEFRPGEIEQEFGPHTLEYLSLKQQVLLDCIKRRQETAYGAKEKSYEYKPVGAFKISQERTPDTHRYPHGQFWR